MEGEMFVPNVRRPARRPRRARVKAPVRHVRLPSIFAEAQLRVRDYYARLLSGGDTERVVFVRQMPRYREIADRTFHRRGREMRGASGGLPNRFSESYLQREKFERYFKFGRNIFISPMEFVRGNATAEHFLSILPLAMTFLVPPLFFMCLCVCKSVKNSFRVTANSAGDERTGLWRALFDAFKCTFPYVRNFDKLLEFLNRRSSGDNPQPLLDGNARFVELRVLVYRYWLDICTGNSSLHIDAFQGTFPGFDVPSFRLSFYEIDTYVLERWINRMVTHDSQPDSPNVHFPDYCISALRHAGFFSNAHVRGFFYAYVDERRVDRLRDFGAGYLSRADFDHYNAIYNILCGLALNSFCVSRIHIDSGAWTLDGRDWLRVLGQRGESNSFVMDVAEEDYLELLEEFPINLPFHFPSETDQAHAGPAHAGPALALPPP